MSLVETIFLHKMAGEKTLFPRDGILNESRLVVLCLKMSQFSSEAVQFKSQFSQSTCCSLHILLPLFFLLSVVATCPDQIIVTIPPQLPNFSCNQGWPHDPLWTQMEEVD